MSLDDIRQILDLVREHDLAEFELEREGLTLRIRKAAAQPVLTTQAPAAPAVVGAAPPPAAPAAEGPASPDAASATAEPPVGVDLAVIESPIVGTFYRAPEPGARAFVEAGDPVRKGQVLCIIEAMKLMNEIESEFEGEVVSIYVENGQPVQFGDRLFAIKVK